MDGMELNGENETLKKWMEGWKGNEDFVLVSSAIVHVLHVLHLHV